MTLASICTTCAQEIRVELPPAPDDILDAMLVWIEAQRKLLGSCAIHMVDKHPEIASAECREIAQEARPS